MTSKAWGYGRTPGDVRRKTTAQAFAILTAIDLKQTNEQQIARCYDKKQNKTEEQQQKWITAA